MATASPLAKQVPGKDWDKRRADHPEVIPELNAANLSRADFRRADLRRADLSQATFGWTLLCDVDLSVAKGLDTVEPFGPSTIIDTLYRSDGKITHILKMGEGVVYTKYFGNWLWTFHNTKEARYEFWRLNLANSQQPRRVVCLRQRAVPRAETENYDYGNSGC
jgi:hypothetical protein